MIRTFSLAAFLVFFQGAYLFSQNIVPQISNTARLVVQAQAGSYLSPQIKLGIDVLADQNFFPLLGKRVGLLTHPAGVNRLGISTFRQVASITNDNQVCDIVINNHNVD